MIVDAALHAGLILPADLLHLGEGAVRRRSWLRRLASGAAESPLETFTRFLLGAAGLSYVEQVEVHRVGRVDFQVESQLVVEADGWQYHGTRDAFESDRRRDQLLLDAGLRTVRLTSRQLRANPSQIAVRIARLVGRERDARLERRVRWALRVPAGVDTAEHSGAVHRQAHFD